MSEQEQFGFIVNPDAWYSGGELRRGLGVKDASLVRARKEGQLRATKIGQRFIYSGSWVLSWLRGEAEPAVGDCDEE